MRILVLLLLPLIFGCRQNADTRNDNTTTPDIEKKGDSLISDFFKGIKSGKYDKALEELLSQNENIDLKDSATFSLQEKFKGINQYSGVYIDSKLLKKRFVNNAVGIFTYLVRYEKKFYRFTFIYYDNGIKVSIYKFTFDDVLEFELEESQKLYAD